MSTGTSEKMMNVCEGLAEGGTVSSEVLMQREKNVEMKRYPYAYNLKSRPDYLDKSLEELWLLILDTICEYRQNGTK